MIKMSSILNKIQNKELISFYNTYNKSAGESLDDNTNLVSMFFKSVKRNPEAIAIIYEDVEISYKTLEQAVKSVSQYLLMNNVKKGEAVIVDADQSFESVAAAIGIMYIGAVYVPIDHDCPEYRKNYIREHCSADFFLTKEIIQRIIKNEENDSATLQEVSLGKTDVAYVIYTSGTTGNPKGVVISHGAAANTIKDIVKRFDIGGQDRIICLSSFGFDLSIFDVFGSLYCGASIVIARNYRDLEELHRVITEKHVTVWNSVPSTMSAYIHFIEKRQYSANTDLRLVMLSGDWIPLKLPKQIKDHMPKARKISLGGATEAGIWSIYYEIKDVDPKWNSIPYGMPLTNQTIYILNSHQMLCPIGVQGDIFIGGQGLAEGYHYDNELTEKAFIIHPEFGRLYFTGDTGIMHNEGYVEFTGRTDSQVKINGYRIELSEIEKCLERAAEVEQAIAVLDRSKESPVIRAFIKRKSNIEKADLIIKCKNLILEELPSYMLPASFTEVEDFPITFNGKVDRAALLKIDFCSEQTNSVFSAPQGEIEKKLAEIIESELDEPRNISRDENLYLLGIDSIHMMNIINKVQDSFKIVINYHDFMKVNSLEEFAAYVEKYINKTEAFNQDVAESNELYYWSEKDEWNVRNGKVYLNDEANIGYPIEFWFELRQFLMRGHKKSEIRELFQKCKIEDSVLEKLISSRIITDEILRPDELFKSQDKYIESDYIFQLNRELYDNYKKKQLNRETYIDDGISFDKYVLKDIPMSRKSIREFDKNEMINMQDFARLISLLRQGVYDGKKKYYYPSAGGFYPIDTYIVVKEKRIKDIEKGIYYYNPIKNSIHRISNTCKVEEYYYFNNKKIANSSAFTIFFVFNANVTFPNYGYMAYFYACLDTGIMTGLINENAGNYNLGVCSIGDFNAEELKKMLKLPKNHILMHAIEGGIPH